MPQASKSTASEHIALEGYEGHFNDFGPYTVGFETYTADADLAPLFVGLPDDRCQCPHMGLRRQGQAQVQTATDRGDVRGRRRLLRAPGHLPNLYAGTEVVEFSPTDELQQTMEVVEKNMEAAGGA